MTIQGTKQIGCFDCPRCGGHHDPAYYMPIECKLRRFAATAVQGQAPEFWSLLTPFQALALLRAAPKVAGPWERPSSNPAVGAMRHGPGGRAVATVFGQHFGALGSDARNWVTFNREGELTNNDGRAPSFDAAKAAADDALRAAGWLLVDDAEDSTDDSAQEGT